MSVVPTSLPRPRQPVRLAAIGLVLLIALALFVPTLSGYVGVRQLQSTDATAVATGLSDDGSVLTVAVTVTNPSGRSLEVWNAKLFAKVDDTLVTQPAGNRMEDTAIAAGSTSTVPVRIHLRDSKRSLAADGVADETVVITGYLRGQIGDSTFIIDVSGGGGDG